MRMMCNRYGGASYFKHTQATLEVIVLVHMAYNITLLDAFHQMRTVALSPFALPKVLFKPLAVNHRGAYELSNYALFSKSYEREQFLVGKLYDPLTTAESFVNAFEYSPFFANN